MTGSWRLGSAFGIPVFVHWTFLLLLGFIAMSQLVASGSQTGSGAPVLVLSPALVVLPVASSSSLVDPSLPLPPPAGGSTGTAGPHAAKVATAKRTSR